MSLLKIDTSGAADSFDFDQLTQLEGREYLLRFTWNDRVAAWYLSLSDQDENPIATGIRIVVNWPLLRRFRDPRLPTGLLLVPDLSGMNQDIVDPLELLPAGRCPLIYYTADDADFLTLVGS